MALRPLTGFLTTICWVWIVGTTSWISPAFAAVASPQSVEPNPAFTNAAPGVVGSSQAGATVRAAFQNLATVPNYRWRVSAFELVFVQSPVSMQLRNYEGKVSTNGWTEARGTVTRPTLQPFPRRQGDPLPPQPEQPPFQAYEFVRNGDSGFYRGTFPGPLMPWAPLGMGFPDAPEKDSVMKEFGELARQSQSPVAALRRILDQAKFVEPATDLYHSYVPEAELRTFLLGQKIELLTPTPMSGSIQIWIQEGLPVKIDLFISGGVDLVGNKSSFHQTINLSGFAKAVIEIPTLPSAASF